eukprot:3811462-Rhodomonas_salina.2
MLSKRGVPGTRVNPATVPGDEHSPARRGPEYPGYIMIASALKLNLFRCLRLSLRRLRRTQYVAKYGHAFAVHLYVYPGQVYELAAPAAGVRVRRHVTAISSLCHSHGASVSFDDTETETSAYPGSEELGLLSPLTMVARERTRM